MDEIIAFQLLLDLLDIPFPNGGPILLDNLDCIVDYPIGSVNRLPSFVLPLMAGVYY